MILEDNIVKTFFNEKANTNIIGKVNELKKLSNFSNFEEINVRSILSKVKLEELKNSKDVSLEIAKLSVHLLVDFNYYSRFCFKTKYDISFFEERLKILGYKNDNGVWKYPLTSKPERSIVLENVFIHHIINELLNSKDKCDPDENESSDIDNDSNTNPMSNGTSNHNNKIENKKKLSLRENKCRTEDNNSHLRESWTCKRCTFVNYSNISNCETCFSANGIEIENLLTKSLTENLPDDKKFIEEKRISVPETIVESASPTSLISNRNDENSELLSSINKNGGTFNLNDEFNDPNEKFKDPNEKFNDPNEKFKDPNEKFNDPNEKFNVNDEFIGMNERNECFKCKVKINKKNLSLCDNCSETYTICPNEACTKINENKNKYCKKCKVKNGSDLKYGNSFRVHRSLKNKFKWQCGFCYTIISESQTKCFKCGNTRESFKSK